MYIGILGGSFDPPHFGHILVTRQVKEFMQFDEIWLMPYFKHSWDATLSSAKHRFAMTKLIEEQGIIASEEEIKFKRKSYTIETIRRLKRKYPHDFFWIVGSDVLPELSKWKEYKKLINETKFVVFPRSGFSISQKLPKVFVLTSSSELVTSNVSSSIVRRRIMNNLSVDGLISESVLKYIKKNKLYEKI